ncbi:BbrUII/HgiDII family restriction enzyme [Nocardiopsis lambiniae]|uniref:ATP-binding protein n=1 Tax=Nocardiopsis lambiniae TaxID=3075539 RepID=A0ABU2M2S9_9ACTN|nr:ATP-binding protein [Nocardiopsis sp. DSM 44743]MDT0326956.1 ATP-binding protein [Nocardiopsis sp. DSM 44743]
MQLKKSRKIMNEETKNQKFTMSVELSVLEALGINLYSNAAAVLSELVANAYDADANRVTIDWKLDGERIVVRDDGCGMDVRQINDRFLTAGYKKRDEEGLSSPKFNRPFMGRKGIGKLSVFSISRSVTVYSMTEGGIPEGLRIEAGALQEAIKENESYHPEPVEVPDEYAVKGTTLILDDLKTKRAAITAAALRKRLARRFDVLDERSSEEGGFKIVVNDNPLTFADRQELKKLEFIWEFGEETIPSVALPVGVSRYVIEDATIDSGRNWKLKGWFGTAKKPTDLTDDEEAGSLKNIIVLARGRPIQEGILEKLDFSRLFGNYVTGQIEADFLDLDGEEFEDIATSDRQRLIEDDERVLALQAFLRKAFVGASEEWSKVRPKKEAIDAIKRFPKLKEWVDARPPWQRDSAEKMIGTIASLELEGRRAGEDRKALFRSGVLAFERVGLRQASEDLEQLSGVTAVDLLPLLGQQDAYEAGLWVDILKSRIRAIEQFQHLTSIDEKEKVLQQHLFDHLWLLDASWERAVAGGKMEENLRNIEPGLFAKEPEGDEITGRIDIRYATLSGRHVIVELKRYSVKVETNDLARQGAKYATALKSLLEQQQRGDEVSKIEVIFVLGKPPGTRGMALIAPEDFYKSQFAPINGRFVLYDALIAGAQNQYEEYLAASESARQLDELLGSLDEVSEE